MFRASKLHDTMRGKPTYPFPTLPLPLLALPPFLGPLCLPPVCGWLCLLLRAQCIATLGAPWFPCCVASGCSLSLLVPLSGPFACPLLLCAHCALSRLPSSR